jgi:AraC-like DNA-binding protein
MEAFENWHIHIVFFMGILGFLVAGILTFVNKTDSFASRLLAGFLVCLSLVAINYSLMTTNFFLSFPHLWRSVGWASFIFSPLAFLYTRSILEQSYRFRKWDFLYFLPALVQFIGLLPFHVLPAHEKRAFLEHVITDRKLITAEIESFLPRGTSMAMRILVGFGATIGQFVLLRNWKKRHSGSFLNDIQNQVMFRWLFMFMLVMAVFWIMVAIGVVLEFSLENDFNFLLIYTVSGAILFVSLYLLVQPAILYGIRGWANKEDKGASSMEDGQIEKFGKAHVSITPEQGIAYKERLETHLNENKPFRKRGYTMGDLSKELGIPAYIISAFINQEYGKNFNELINEYRVNHLVGEMKNSVDYSKYTLEALGQLAGFNSRAAFITAVKKYTGKSPSSIFGRRT